MMVIIINIKKNNHKHISNKEFREARSILNNIPFHSLSPHSSLFSA